MLSRRHMMAASAAFCSLGNVPIAVAQDVSKYDVLFPISKIPRPLASCSQIRSLISDYRNQRDRLRQNHEEEGNRLRQEIVKLTEQWRKELSLATAKQVEAEQDAFITRTLFAAGIILTGFGAVASTPLAVGAVVGVSIIAGPAALYLQAFSEKDAEDRPPLLVGYGAERIFTLSQIVGEQSSSTAGRVIGRSSAIVSLALSAYYLFSSNTDKKIAVQRAEEARREVEQLEKSLERLDGNAMWALLRDRSLTSSISALERFLEKTESANCVVLQEADNVVIRPAP